MITSRMGATRKYNLSYGLDGVFRVSAKDYLYVNWAQTFEDAMVFRPIDSALLRLFWERNANVGVGYNATLVRSGEHFDPALGYKIRDDFTSLGSQVSYGWIPPESSSFQVQRFTLDNTAVFRNADGKAESAELGLTWNGDTKTGAFYVAGVRLNYESLPATFRVAANAYVPPGDYAFYSLRSVEHFARSCRAGAAIDQQPGDDGQIYIHVQPLTGCRKSPEGEKQSVTGRQRLSRRLSTRSNQGCRLRHSGIGWWRVEPLRAMSGCVRSLKENSFCCARLKLGLTLPAYFFTLFSRFIQE